MAELSPEELAMLRSGQVTLDDIIAGQQQNQPYGNLSPQGQQYLAMLGVGQAGLGDYIGQTAEQYYQIPGIEDIKPGYQWDDLLAGAKEAQNIAAEQGKAGYQTWLGEQNLVLKQNADERAAAKFESEFSSPDIDYRALQWAGITDQDLADTFASGKPEAMNFIGQALGMVDKDGNPTWQHPENLKRLTALEQMPDLNAQRQIEQNQQADTAFLSQRRYGGLSPQQRMKEVYLRQSDPSARVGLSGRAYTGPTAAEDANELQKFSNMSNWNFVGNDNTPSPSRSSVKKKGTDWSSPRSVWNRAWSTVVGDEGPVVKSKRELTRKRPSAEYQQRSGSR